jgi:hypothetical protein
MWGTQDSFAREDPKTSTRNEARVPHISLVFREMWDTTNPTLRFSMTHLYTLGSRLQLSAHPQKSLTV